MGDTYGMDPTWGALEEALDPQRQRILAELLAGKAATDPGMTSLTGGAPAGKMAFGELALPPAAPPVSPAPTASPGAPPQRRAPMTVYDTPYGEELRKADKEVKGAFWGYQHENTRRDRERLTRLAESYIARSEGREIDDSRTSAAERATENALTKSVLDASADDSAQRSRQRIAEMARKRFSRGGVIDRGAAGVFQPVYNEDTGETAIERLDIPALEEKPKPPTVHGLGAGGGVYFDAQGRPRVIAPSREPKGAPKEPREPQVPAGVTEKMIDLIASSPDFDPNDPQALGKMVLMLRQQGLLPGGAPAPAGPSAEEAAALTHAAPGRGPAVVSGRVGGPARGGARPPTARNPRTGEMLVLRGGQWVPAR